MASIHVSQDEIALEALWRHWKRIFQDLHYYVTFEALRRSHRVTWNNVLAYNGPVVGLDFSNYGLGGSVPSEIGQFVALSCLCLRGNQLTTLPADIGKLSTLEQLRIDNNELESLPPEIGKLSSLQCLNVTNNRLTRLPPELGNCSSLQQLFVAGNRLMSLPRAFDKLVALRVLLANHNCLTAFPFEIVEHLPLLQTLSLVGNYLLEIYEFPARIQDVYVQNQYLPTQLQVVLNDESVAASSPSSPDTDFNLLFQERNVKTTIALHVDVEWLATRWTFLRSLLDANLSETQSRQVDLSAYFSIQLGRCIVSLLCGRVTDVTALQNQDCLDFIEYAPEFHLDQEPSDLLLKFCKTKLARAAQNQ